VTGRQIFGFLLVIFTLSAEGKLAVNDPCDLCRSERSYFVMHCHSNPKLSQNYFHWCRAMLEQSHRLQTLPQYCKNLVTEHTAYFAQKASSPCEVCLTGINQMSADCFERKIKDKSKCKITQYCAYRVNTIFRYYPYFAVGAP
jgi:hypothetical protein